MKSVEGMNYFGELSAGLVKRCFPIGKNLFVLGDLIYMTV
jgi:hypothetical protein